MKTMLRRALFTIPALALAATLPLRGQQAQPPAPSGEGLPDAPGKDVTVRACGLCHEAKRAASCPPDQGRLGRSDRGHDEARRPALGSGLQGRARLPVDALPRRGLAADQREHRTADRPRVGGGAPPPGGGRDHRVPREERASSRPWTTSRTCRVSTSARSTSGATSSSRCRARVGGGEGGREGEGGVGWGGERGFVRFLYRITIAAPSDQKLPTTSGMSPSDGRQVAERRDVLRGEQLESDPRGWPKGPSAADDHRQRLRVDRIRADTVHPVADERHPRAALEKEALRGPRAELRHPIEMCRVNADRPPDSIGTQNTSTPTSIRALTRRPMFTRTLPVFRYG